MWLQRALSTAADCPGGRKPTYACPSGNSKSKGPRSSWASVPMKYQDAGADPNSSGGDDVSDECESTGPHGIRRRFGFKKCVGAARPIGLRLWRDGVALAVRSIGLRDQTNLRFIAFRDQLVLLRWHTCRGAVPWRAAPGWKPINAIPRMA